MESKHRRKQKTREEETRRSFEFVYRRNEKYFVKNRGN